MFRTAIRAAGYEVGLADVLRSAPVITDYILMNKKCWHPIFWQRSCWGSSVFHQLPSCESFGGSKPCSPPLPLLEPAWGPRCLGVHVPGLLSNQWLMVLILKMFGICQQQDPLKLNHSCPEYTWFSHNWLSQQFSQGGNHQGAQISPCLQHNASPELGRC